MRNRKIIVVTKTNKNSNQDRGLKLPIIKKPIHDSSEKTKPGPK